MPPVPIQIVFQGGGARLACLMATVSVLKKLQQDEVIEITAIGGASAGAIAACMLASPKSATELESLVEIAFLKQKRLLTKARWFNFHRWIRFLRLATGRPYFPKDFLNEVFSPLFGEATTIKQLAGDRTLGLYATNIELGCSWPIEERERVARALQASAGLPFLFVGSADVALVDGGLASNLPVEDFVGERDKRGDVLAIGFESEVASYPSGLALNVKYLAKLFSAAIASGVARSRAMLPEDAFFPIETDLSLLDFEKAIEFLKGSEAKTLRDKFAKHIENWLEVRKVDGAQRIWLAPTPMSVDYGALYRQALLNPGEVQSKPIHMKRRVDVDREILGTEKRNEKIEFFHHTQIEFVPLVSRPLVNFEFQLGPQDQVRNLSVSTYDSDGMALHYKAVTEPAVFANRSSFRIWIEFLSDLELEPVKRYFISFRYKYGDAFPSLQEGEPDFSVVRSSFGATDEGIVIAAVDHARLRGDWHTADITKSRTKDAIAFSHRLKNADALSREECEGHLGGVDTTRLKLFGAIARNANQFDAYGFAIEQRKV